MLAGIAEIRFFPKKEIKLVDIEKLLKESIPTPRIPLEEKKAPKVRAASEKLLTKPKESDILEKVATLALLGALVAGIWLNIQES